MPSSSASGTEPDEVLPCLSTVTTTRSIGMSRRLAVASMMRKLAWCGISQSMSWRSRPLACSVSSTTLSSALTAYLNTSLPAMWMRTPAFFSCSLNPTDTPTGFHNSSFLPPSACRWVLRMPVSLSALSTTAPAPSPNSTHVPRSLQSSMRVSVSAPTTRTVLAAPERMNLSATVRAYTKPEQAALTSNAGQPLAPSRCCNRQAVDGKIKSGVVVPSTIRSSSEACTPAASSARTAAWYARSQVVSPRSEEHTSELQSPCNLVCRLL